MLPVRDRKPTSLFERMSTLGGKPLPDPIAGRDPGDETPDGCTCIPCQSGLTHIMPCLRQGEGQ